METVGEYEYSLKDLIGHGAFAVVFKGRHQFVSQFIVKFIVVVIYSVIVCCRRFFKFTFYSLFFFKMM